MLHCIIDFVRRQLILDNPLRFILIIIFIVISVNGCSLFTPTQRPDLSPYADNIIKIYEDIQYGLSQSQVVYLRDYINGPKVELLQDYGDKTKKMLRSIIAYSVEVVTLGHSKVEEKEKAKRMADYLEGLRWKNLSRGWTLLPVSLIRSHEI